MGPTTPHCKTLAVTETPTRELREDTALGESSSSARRQMTFCGESQEPLEATGPTILLSTRKNITIGTWNVRTMYQTGKTFQIAQEMKNYNLVLLGISEARWTQSGQKRLEWRAADLLGP